MQQPETEYFLNLNNTNLVSSIFAKESPKVEPNSSLQEI